MSNAWEILTANATDTTDAWAALNSKVGSVGTGLVVDELKFNMKIDTPVMGVLTLSKLTGVLSKMVFTGKITDLLSYNINLITLEETMNMEDF